MTAHSISGCCALLRSQASQRQWSSLKQQQRPRRILCHAQAAAPPGPQVAPEFVSTSTTGSLAFASACEQGTTLVTIPDEAWLTPDVVEASSIGQATQGCAPWVRLVVYLIHAEAKGDPQWGSYLAQAEEATLKPAALWSAADLDELKGTQVYDTVLQYQQFFASQHKGLASVLEALGSETQAACSLERFTLAAATVRARLLPMFPIDKPRLIPGMTGIVHSRNPSVKVSIKEEGLFKKTQKLLIEASTTSPAGAPLSLDFAPGKLESQVALDYGMYDIAAPQTGYLLTLSIPSEEQDSCHFDKVDVAELQEMGATQAYTLKVAQAPPPEMLAYLRLMNLQGMDSFLLEGIFRAEAWGHMMEPVSEANETAICDSMIDGCEAALAAFSTSLADDIRALDALDDVTSPKSVALRVRSDEKKILEGTAEWFKRRKESLKELEYYQERRLKRLGLMDDDGNSTFEDMIKINV